MKLRHLRAFLAVADELHFTRAAQRLHVAQPAVSAAVRELEEELGFVLFERTRRRVALTAAGRRFQEDAAAVLADLERAVESAERVARGQTGRVVVDFTPLAALSPLPEALVRFRAERPEVVVELTQHGTVAQAARLEAGTCDLGFTVFAGELGRLSAERLTDEPLVVLLPAAHPWAGAPEVPAAAVVGEPMLILPRRSEPAMHAAWRGLCARVGAVPRLELELDQMDAVLAFVAAGAGVSLAPASVARLRMDGVAVVPLAPAVRAGITVVWDGGTGNPAALALLDTVRAVRDGAPR